MGEGRRLGRHRRGREDGSGGDRPLRCRRPLGLTHVPVNIGSGFFIREHFICSRMKKPLPFVLGGGARAVLVVAIMEPQFSRRVLLKINFIVVALRYVNV